MKKINIALLALIFCNTACFANFGFYLNNHSGTELRLVHSKTRWGKLMLPSSLSVGTQNAYGTSTSDQDDSEGKFSYGVDSKNYCTVNYAQYWVFFKTVYTVKVESQVGNIFCSAIQEDGNHPSNVTIRYYKL